MVLSDSLMFNIFKSSPRSSLYYRDYCYATQFYIRDASSLRVLSHKHIDKYINIRYSNNNYSTRWGEPGPDAEQLANLHDMCNRLLAFKESYKKMVYYNHVYIYTNSLEDLENVVSAPYVILGPVVQADVCLPENVVFLKEPKRKFRTYLKEKWIPEGQTPVLRKFLLNRTECYDFTPLFKTRLETWDRFYTMSHFFIDHDDPKDLLMLNLVCPGLIRKTMPIQAK